MTALLIVLCAFISVIFLASYIIYRRVFHTPGKGQNDLGVMYKGKNNGEYKDEVLSLTHALSEKKCEMLHIKSRDGLTLEGRFYSTTESHGIVICAHGYRGIALRDWAGKTDDLLALGYSVLLPSQRGSMKSEGHTITFGTREREDLLLWIEKMKKDHPDKPIYLFGISMGAYTVLSVAGEVDSSVRGIIADCPYTSPKEEFESVMKRDSLPRFLLLPLLEFSALLWGRFRLTGINVKEEVSHSDIPVLLFHGTKDHLVPYFMSVEIARSRSENITLVPVEGADHCMAYYVDRSLFLSSLEEFFRVTGKTRG